MGRSSWFWVSEHVSICGSIYRIRDADMKSSLSERVPPFLSSFLTKSGEDRMTSLVTTPSARF